MISVLKSAVKLIIFAASLIVVVSYSRKNQLSPLIRIGVLLWLILELLCSCCWTIVFISKATATPHMVTQIALLLISYAESISLLPLDILLISVLWKRKMKTGNGFV